jgi:hypothetical protein
LRWLIITQSAYFEYFFEFGKITKRYPEMQENKINEHIEAKWLALPFARSHNVPNHCFAIGLLQAS